MKCPACGGEFGGVVEYTNHKGKVVARPRKYCDRPECVRARNYANVRAWAEKHRPTAKPNPQGPRSVRPDGRRVCEHCHRTFDPPSGRRGALRYCSVECREAKRNECQAVRRAKLAERIGRLGLAVPELPAHPRAPNHAPGPAAAARKASQESGRRWGIDPTTCEREYADDERVFLMAMEEYKRKCKRPFPTWSEALQVLVSLGYRKTEQPGPLPGC